MAEKEVADVSSGFDHIVALNKAGFAVKGVQKLEKRHFRTRFRTRTPEFDFANERSVQQQAALMGLLDQAPKAMPEAQQQCVADVDQDMRAERRERERQRLTAALHSVLNNVSPQRSTWVKPFLRNDVKAKVSVQQDDAEVRVALRGLFGSPAIEKVKSTHSVSLFRRMLDYRVEFVPPWHSMFHQRDDRMNIINQLKEVYK